MTLPDLLTQIEAETPAELRRQVDRWIAAAGQDEKAFRAAARPVLQQRYGSGPWTQSQTLAVARVLALMEERKPKPVVYGADHRTVIRTLYPGVAQ